MFVIIAEQTLPPALFDEVTELARKTLSTMQEALLAETHQERTTAEAKKRAGEANARLARMVRTL